MREQFDKSKWVLCCEVINEILFRKCERLLQQYPFKTNNEGISPELVKESMIVLENMVELLRHLKCDESLPSI